MTNLDSILKNRDITLQVCIVKAVDFPGGSDGKASAYNEGDLGSIPGSGRSPGEGKGYPLHYCGLENPMDSPWGSKELGTTEQLSLAGLP